MRFPFQLKNSQVIFLEGLDATGKSTQMERIERGCYTDMNKSMFQPIPLFVHLPSGTTALGQSVYEFTENNKIKDPLARQHLHWASHREEYASSIKPALKEGKSVIFDRGWWSAVAYCWFGNPKVQALYRLEDFIDQCKLAMPVEPDLVCLFLEPHAEDKHNTPGVLEGYQWLAEAYPKEVVLITSANQAEQNLQIFQAMADRKIYWDDSDDPHLPAHEQEDGDHPHGYWEAGDY